MDRPKDAYLFLSWIPAALLAYLVSYSRNVSGPIRVAFASLVLLCVIGSLVALVLGIVLVTEEQEHGRPTQFLIAATAVGGLPILWMILVAFGVAPGI